MARVAVTKAQPADQAQWLRLWEEWQAHMKGSVPADISAKTWAAILDDASGLHALLARDEDGQALGFAHISVTPFAWTASDILFLQDLFVSETARGLGVGGHLLDGVYRLGDELGASQVFWMVDEDDPDLQRFYARHAMRTPYLRYMRQPWPW
jgi:GNAT superfamily N-acetyltransferase